MDTSSWYALDWNFRIYLHNCVHLFGSAKQTHRRKKLWRGEKMEISPRWGYYSRRWGYFRIITGTIVGGILGFYVMHRVELSYKVRLPKFKPPFSCSYLFSILIGTSPTMSHNFKVQTINLQNGVHSRMETISIIITFFFFYLQKICTICGL